MKIYRFSQIDSTNDFIRKNINKIEIPSIVIAKTQEKGRGRFGRLWASPVGGLYFSLVTEWKGPPLPFIVPVAISDILSGVGVNVSIRWPNDIFFKKKKLGGILIEAASGKMIIGIGINVNNRVENLPEVLREKSISLIEIKEQQYILEEMALKISNKILKLQYSKRENILSRYIKKLEGIGGKCEIQQGTKLIKGTIEGVDINGRLILIVNGKKNIIHSGAVKRLGASRVSTDP